MVHPARTDPRRMRFDAAEISGSLGDLGTFIPLAVSLIAVCGLDAGTVLVFAGLFNIVTGLVFRQPLPVQPMKAIAAVAIAEGLTVGEIAAAGFGAGVVVLALALTGAVEAVERRIPRPVVRGLQLGIGLKLASAGLAMVLGTTWWSLDGRLLALAAAILVLVTLRSERFPTALLLLAVGLVLVAREPPPTDGPLLWTGPHWVAPTLSEWREGLLRAAVPQVPLTLLNSVIAVCVLSGDLFPGRGIGTRAMASSVGLMNAGACLFGAMPACHGSGGLAAQYQFGARTGGSVVFLGGVKLALGVALGGAAIAWLEAFPPSILGVLLAFAGLRLALPARECTRSDPFLIAVATAVGILAVNALVGVLVGMGVAALLRADAGSKERP